MELKKVRPADFRLGRSPQLVKINEVAEVTGLKTEDVWSWLIESGDGVAWVSDKETLQKVHASGRVEGEFCYLYGGPGNFRTTLIRGGLYVRRKDVSPLLKEHSG